MSKVILFSTVFPKYHIRAGESTNFIDKITKGEKIHTIRGGRRFKDGDMFSPRIWGNDINPKSSKSGPYQSKQIILGADMKIYKTYDFEISSHGDIYIDDKCIYHFCEDRQDYIDKLCVLAKNDGLTSDDLIMWLKYPLPFTGQIICWTDKVKY